LIAALTPDEMAAKRARERETGSGSIDLGGRRLAGSIPEGVCQAVTDWGVYGLSLASNSGKSFVLSRW
jgi:hypothetical protein